MADRGDRAEKGGTAMGGKSLTARQAEILDYLRETIDMEGVPPTIREIGERFGIRSTKGVEDHLAALVRKEVIRREPGKSRAIVILDRPDFRSARSVPLVGSIAAGSPILAVENREADFIMDEALLGSGETFLLTVKGDSMEEAAILDGDLVVVRSQSQAASGEIIAARLGEEATVKRLRRSRKGTTLEPANAAYDPIPVSASDEFEILGKVVGIYRRL
jgi:repressor LexA